MLRWIRGKTRTMMGIVVPGKTRRGRPRPGWIDNNWEDIKKYELTADITENRQDIGANLLTNIRVILFEGLERFVADCS